MKINKIEICFPVPVEPPDGFYHVLDALVDMICKKYEKENPTRVMWTAGHGSKPTWSKHDAAYLGKETDSDAPDMGSPTFDNSVYQIDVSEREDFYGHNKHNPNADKLQREAKARKSRVSKQA